MFNLEDIINATEANLLIGKPSKNNHYCISTDTRTIKETDVYLPLKGESFDGFTFINNALNKNIAGYFLDKSHNINQYNNNDNFVLQVENTLLALLALGSFHRKRLDCKIIAITGSSGKTTTKEMVYSVLSESFKVQKSLLNHNNEIGVSKTLLNIQPQTEIAVLEMGMRGLGEIDLLAKYALPDISLITNIGTSHIGRLGSKENIAIAKTEILKYLDPQNGLAFLHGEDKLLLDYSEKICNNPKILFGMEKDIEIINHSENTIIFNYKNEEYILNVPGKHNVINASSAIEIGKYFNMNYNDIYNGLKKYTPLFGRWEEYTIEKTKIINDAYNANPESMKASIDTVIQAYPNIPKWLVLGNMLELGNDTEQMHKGIGQWLKDKQIETVISIGNMAKYITDELNNSNIKTFNFSEPEKAIYLIKENINFDKIVLLKASRGIGLEIILDKLGLKEGGYNY